MISNKAVVYRMKRTGPSTEPWGTPHVNCNDGEDRSLTGSIDICLRDTTEAIGVQQTEYQNESRGGRWEFGGQYYQKLQKGLTTAGRTEMLSLSRAERMSFTTRNKTVSVLWPARYADWKGLQRLFSWRGGRNLWRTTFSTILERSGRLEMER